MTGLMFARAVLIGSMVLFAAALLAGKLTAGKVEVELLVGIIAVAGMVFSASACIALQMLAVIRSKAAHNG